MSYETWSGDKERPSPLVFCTMPPVYVAPSSTGTGNILVSLQWWTPSDYYNFFKVSSKQIINNINLIIGIGIYNYLIINGFLSLIINTFQTRSSLLIESTDSMILILTRPKKHFKNEQRSKDAAAKKRLLVNATALGSLIRPRAVTRCNLAVSDMYMRDFGKTHQIA